MIKSYPNLHEIYFILYIYLFVFIVFFFFLIYDNKTKTPLTLFSSYVYNNVNHIYIKHCYALKKKMQNDVERGQQIIVVMIIIVFVIIQD